MCKENKPKGPAVLAPRLIGVVDSTTFYALKYKPDPIWCIRAYSQKPPIFKYNTYLHINKRYECEYVLYLSVCLVSLYSV